MRRHLHLVASMDDPRFDIPEPALQFKIENHGTIFLVVPLNPQATHTS